MTRTWKVYGAEGHRQRESFRNSYIFVDAGARIYNVQNSDLTGTNDYTLIEIDAENSEACYDALLGQISDGIFGNSRVGRIEEVLA